ncbi:hypothetical protein CEUSTIGMA_g6050.t1 [Chlamydomonas eustigma]|uniref:ELYS-like domain-containing protein n=1 Tax=Chlamydomonas eustigma TaxID=1157962 RepID=A0A250X6A9_9CHLO|nr:hypothetical protein CEUSTIGMA_g6050.t1 [Chlamydomonas eustigma]|eukprot:GAX78611.1 hypothetical protein CEUSTIGMA_g6050.t1 [Chlamydomonas eustigma]
MADPQVAKNTAKHALIYWSKLLSSRGIQVDPEVLRQAKFNEPVADDVFKSLHDLVLMRLAGFQPLGSPLYTSHESIWRQLRQEGLSSSVAVESLLFVCHYLHTWGCPTFLVSHLFAAAESSLLIQLCSQQGEIPGLNYYSHDSAAMMSSQKSVRSRVLLLTLGWLTYDSRLFEDAIMYLHPTAELRCMLLPLPEDSCLCSATKEAYTQAVNQSWSHVQHVQTMLSQQRSRSTTDKKPSPWEPAEQVWESVEVASHQALMMLGKAKTQLSSLQSLMDCRMKLQANVQGKLQEMGSQSMLLSSLDIHLMVSSQDLETHIQALEAVTVSVSRQLDISSSAQVLSSWLQSVIAEEAKSAGLQHFLSSPSAPAAASSSPPSTSRTSTSTSPAPDPSVMQSLQKLPSWDSRASRKLMDHLDQQLQQAVQVAGPRLSAARAAEKLSAYSRKQSSSIQNGRSDINMQQFYRLGDHATSNPGAVNKKESQNEPREEESRWSSLSCWSLPTDLEICESSDASLNNTRWAEEDALIAAVVASSKHDDPLTEKEADRVVEATLSLGRALAQTRGANNIGFQKSMSPCLNDSLHIMMR